MPFRQARPISESARRALHTRSHTLYSPTPEYLSQFLKKHPPAADSTSLFLLSTSLPDLPSQLSTLQALLPSSIGSFSVSPPGHEATISLATFWDSPIRVFRSELSGRPPVQVGRWKRPEPRGYGRAEENKGLQEGEAESVLNEQGWAGLWNTETEFGRIPDLDNVKASSFLLLSDGRPSPVLRALDDLYPSATKAGLLTAATPFITNRPHTLLHNGQVYSAGTIGLAIDAPASSHVNFGLSPMTGPVTIANAQGNMLLEIDGTNSNPTQVLISAIQKRGGIGITKEEDFFLGFLQDGQVKRVVKILSGDPSRGALSLEMEEALLVGQTIQFLHRSDATPSPSPLNEQIRFTTIQRSDEDEDIRVAEPRVVEGFLASSENGFIYSNPTTSVCSAPGASTSISWGR